MSDFTSGFWAWFIAIGTIVSLIGILWLIRWMSGGGPAPGGKPQTMGHVWDEDLAELNNPLPRWWLQMFYITLIFAAGYLVLYPGLGAFRGLLGWEDTTAYDQEMAAAAERYGPIYDRYRSVPIATLIDDPEAVQIGERLFSTVGSSRVDLQACKLEYSIVSPK